MGKKSRAKRMRQNGRINFYSIIEHPTGPKLVGDRCLTHLLSGSVIN